MNHLIVTPTALFFAVACPHHYKLHIRINQYHVKFRFHERLFKSRMYRDIVSRKPSLL